jgi:hypothetical protein
MGIRALSLLFGLAISIHASEWGGLSGVVRLTNQPVADAVVYLGAGGGYVTPTNVVLDVRDGVLLPRVQMATRASVLVLRNSDPTLHIIRVEALSGTNTPMRALTQAMPYAGFQKAFGLGGFRDTTLLRVTGGNGEMMTAYVAVLPHPWGSLTDSAGRFTLAGVPAGNYKLYAWHELFGTLTRDVDVTAGRATQFDLDFTDR